MRVSVELLNKVKRCFWNDYDLDDSACEQIVETIRERKDGWRAFFIRIALNPDVSPRDLVLLTNGDRDKLASALREIPHQRLLHLERRRALLVSLLTDAEEEEIAGTEWRF